MDSKLRAAPPPGVEPPAVEDKIKKLEVICCWVTIIVVILSLMIGDQ